MALDAGTIFPLAVVAAVAGAGMGRRRGGGGGGLLTTMLQSMQQEEQQRLAHDLQTQREREAYKMQLILPLVQQAVTRGIGVEEFKDMLDSVGVDPSQLTNMRREFFEAGRGDETRNLARLLDSDAMNRYLEESTYGGLNKWFGSDEGRNAMRRAPLVDVFLKSAQTQQGLDALGMLPSGGKGILSSLFEDPTSAVSGIAEGTLASKKLDNAQRLSQIAAQKAGSGGGGGGQPAGPEDIMRYELSMFLRDNQIRRSKGEPELPVPKYLQAFAAKVGVIEKPKDEKPKRPTDILDEELANVLMSGGEIPQHLKAYAARVGATEKPDQEKQLTRSDFDQIRKTILGYDDGGFFTKGVASVAETPESAVRAIQAAYGYNEDALKYALRLLGETESLPNRNKNPFYGKITLPTAEPRSVSTKRDSAETQRQNTAPMPSDEEAPKINPKIMQRIMAGLNAGVSPEEILKQAESTGNQAVVQQVMLALQALAATGK
jgi:hypothetical protein